MEQSVTARPVTGQAGEHEWRRFALTFLSVFLGGLAILFIAIIVIDPYDTGRFPTFISPGVSDTEQMTNVASRARTPNFNAAIVGNSHGALLRPAVLSEATGLAFMHLSTPGTGPREHMALLHYFRRHHPDIRGAVIVADETWCTHDPELPVYHSFPLWLYSDSAIDYVIHMLNTRTLGRARKRVEFALGKGAAIDPAGLWDYEHDRSWNFQPPLPKSAAETADTSHDPIDTHFPAIEALDKSLAELPTGTPVVIVMPPQYFTLLPPPGSKADRERAVCKAELAKRVAGRPRSGFFDWLRDTPLSRDPANFLDAGHYKGTIAHLIEQQIIATFTGGTAQPPPD